MDKVTCFFVGMLIGVCILTLALVVADLTPLRASQETNQNWQKILISKGFAEYNSTNGNWQWKNLDSNRNK
jgi:hypothetical protein